MSKTELQQVTQGSVQFLLHQLALHSQSGTERRIPSQSAAAAATTPTFTVNAATVSVAANAASAADASTASAAIPCMGEPAAAAASPGSTTQSGPVGASATATVAEPHIHMAYLVTALLCLCMAPRSQVLRQLRLGSSLVKEADGKY